MNEQKKMTEMNEWLDEVCAALGVDRGLLAEVTPEVLDLVGRVAHGPSRPGGPLGARAGGMGAAPGGGGGLCRPAPGQAHPAVQPFQHHWQPPVRRHLAGR